ncbi:fatty acid cis/trans isomerase [Nitrogeniibacter aestuarii]|uniref:fatty acid cis/trans isomerase n=1 Tax=Nitrogeniibacter aestuarii TaxID=2815343 RepID=UPI001D128EE0|nr:fatty acid cis/trans isomerase [Nitrogeniibacter aestuarii]
MSAWKEWGRGLAMVVTAVLLAACAADESVTEPVTPTRYDTRQSFPDAVSYQQSVQPIFANRCIVCHACYDAPCQLKLTAWEGVARGGSKTPVYGQPRLNEIPPTRLFEDASKASQWRQMGFHPVLDENAPPGGDTAARSASLMARMLRLKAQHPGPTAGPLPAEDFEFDINRKLSCPAPDEFEDFAEANPEWGMPYGLPAIPADEQATLIRWLDQGAPADALPELTAQQRGSVQAWEAFFNADSLKARLMSRYIYEHLFLGHLYFIDDPQRRYFRLVRSSTPPGQPVTRIASRRPHDDPGVPRVWYRLVADNEVVVAKTHMPYRLDAERMARWQALFIDADYTVDALPGYRPEDIANPFRTFAAIPPANRYRFMLDEAAFTIGGFIKGPVCRGQAALNVINDHFWVFFADPSNDLRDARVDEYLRDQATNMALPTNWASDLPLAINWVKYSEREVKYLEGRSRFLDEVLDGPLDLDLNLIWDGEGRNPNAALTIYRHLDSATVLQGLAGDTPKTAWVFTYPLLERVHYLLVANFDVFGSVSHQLESRLYMDFLRMEGEFNFLAYLPKALRKPTRDAWYRESSDEEKKFIYGEYAWLNHETGIHYQSAHPETELFELMRKHVSPAIGQRNRIEALPDAALRDALAPLAALTGQALAWLPENVILRIDMPSGESQYISLMRNTAHLNVSQILDEADRLDPDRNTLSLVPGVVGAYPNALYRMALHELPAFITAVASLDSEEAYSHLAARYAIRRTAPAFWTESDALHAAYRKLAPIEAGMLDYNRLENR